MNKTSAQGASLSTILLVIFIVLKLTGLDPGNHDHPGNLQVLCPTRDLASPDEPSPQRSKQRPNLALGLIRTKGIL